MKTNVLHLRCKIYDIKLSLDLQEYIESILLMYKLCVYEINDDLEYVEDFLNLLKSRNAD